jgi:hypothetical protein
MNGQLSLFRGRAPLIVAHGMGVDSVAMCLGLHQRGIRPDLILHADTGGEHPETYAYIPECRRWLASVGFPDLTIVRFKPVVNGKRGSYADLYGNCLACRMLPSLAYGGRRGCSQKFKRGPQDAFVNHWGPAIEWWATGGKCVKWIGYDAGPKDIRRPAIPEDAKYVYAYPLQTWGWDRERCIEEILRAGVKLPRKSACFFCPAAKPWEIAELVAYYPELADRIILMETTAKPRLWKIHGLWGRPVLGRRGAIPHPGSMTEFILQLRADPAMLQRYLEMGKSAAPGVCLAAA